MISASLRQTIKLDERRVVATLLAAFAADPAVRWMYPDPQQYLTHFPGFVLAFAGKAFAHGTAEVLDGVAAAALWLPPGASPDETAVVDLLQRSVNERQQPDLFRLFEQMGAYHPAEPHWYLPLMGVDPHEQGRGLGSALLRRVLARCDHDQMPAYLEATNPRNASLYERLGFQRIGRIQAGGSPEIIPMLRRAGT